MGQGAGELNKTRGAHPLPVVCPAHQFWFKELCKVVDSLWESSKWLPCSSSGTSCARMTNQGADFKMLDYKASCTGGAQKQYRGAREAQAREAVKATRVA